MTLHLRGTLAVLLLCSCDDAQQPHARPTVRQDSKTLGASRSDSMAQRYAQDVKGATVTVHQACRYKGEWVLRNQKDLRLIAVDVEIRNAGEFFALEEVEIIDGATGRNHGSLWFRQRLTSDGQPEDRDADPTFSHLALTDGIRSRLVYAAPTGCRSIHLSYWGVTLTRDAVPVREE